MKNLSLLLLIAATVLFFTHCGGPDNSQNAETENAETEAIPVGSVPLDLSSYGYPLTMYVPYPDESLPEATVDVLESGALEIRAGEDFQILLNLLSENECC